MPAISSRCFQRLACFVTPKNDYHYQAFVPRAAVAQAIGSQILRHRLHELQDQRARHRPALRLPARMAADGALNVMTEKQQQQKSPPGTTRKPLVRFFKRGR
jgi:hypothetical protein